MTSNVCPNCSQVTLSLGGESEIRCPICGTLFGIKRDDSDMKSSFAKLNRD